MSSPKPPNVSGVLGGKAISINVTLTGWDQLINATQTVQTQFINQQLDPGISNLNNFLYTKMKEKMHVWKGKRPAGKPHMKDVTKEVKLGIAQYQVKVPVPYALAENRRPGAKAGFGPHRYAEPSIQQTIQHIPIFTAEMQRWLNAQFSKVKG